MIDKFACVKRRTLAEQVYDRLKEEIIMQHVSELSMGSAINEVELAKRLDCSTTPVREAINMLRRDGLVEGNSFRASKIVSYTQKDVEDLYTMREELEVMAIRQAMHNITDKDIKNLKAIHRKYIEMHQLMDSVRVFNTNREFHNCILDIANNAVLKKMLDSLSDQAALLRAPTLEEKFTTSIGKSMAIEEHARIIEAVEQRDMEKACDVMRSHVARLGEEVCTYYNQHVALLDS